MDKFIVTSNDDDIIGLSPTRAAPSRGRRAGQKLNDSVEKDVTSPTSTVSNDDQTTPESFELPGADRLKHRRLMWDQFNAAEVVQDSRLINDDSDSDENVIPIIPDLDETNEEELMQSVAVPPAIFQELLSYRELDSDLMRQSAFSMLDNEIDLKILTKSLVREKDLIEPEEPWEMNQLFAEIQSMATRSRGSSETKVDEHKEMLI